MELDEQLVVKLIRERMVKVYISADCQTCNVRRKPNAGTLVRIATGLPAETYFWFCDSCTEKADRET